MYLFWNKRPLTGKVVRTGDDAKDAQIAGLEEGLRIVREERNLAIAERDEARAELAPLKAARDRANANLVAANARRRAGVQKERA